MLEETYRYIKTEVEVKIKRTISAANNLLLLKC